MIIQSHLLNDLNIYEFEVEQKLPATTYDIIAPCGQIMFILRANGKHCSDKFIASESGFLNYLFLNYYAGDEAMADRDFKIGDLFFLKIFKCHSIVQHLQQVKNSSSF